MEKLSPFSFLIPGTQGLVLFKFKPMMPSFDRSQNGEKMWVKICNLNLIPKIGGSESRSCGRRDPFFWNFPLMLCLCEPFSFHFTVGSLFTSKDFSLAKGREQSMPYSFCSLSLSCKFLSAVYPSSKPLSCFFFPAISDIHQLSGACGVFPLMPQYLW